MSDVHLHQCPSKIVCSDLAQLLYEFDVGDDVHICSGVETAWPCADAIHNVKLLYESVTTANSQRVIDFISPLFASSSQLMNPHFAAGQSRDAFFCPELQIDIYAPCSVDSCVFYTQDPWVKNCILYYRIRHDRDVLNLNELAFLLRRDVGKLRTSLSHAFRTLSRAALKEMILRDCRPEMVTRLHNPRVCAVCEKSIDADDRVVRRGNLIYCKRACYEEKPPQIIALEQDFGLSVRRILELCTERFSNVKNMGAALGIGSRVFIALCSRHGLAVPSHKLL